MLVLQTLPLPPVVIYSPTATLENQGRFTRSAYRLSGALMHKVWSVRYHPTRDQLLVSAGSDSYVCLYGLPSYSSDVKEFPPFSTNRVPARSTSSGLAANLDDLEAASATTYGSTISDKLQDGLLAKVDQHEECVYAVDWSPVDTWVFASVNYDGTFLVNRVPDSIKLGILLHEEDEEELEE
ncbi:unnamed protein product [Dibothriocephalus latus]|uniref:Protein TSSC1 n=1 Tax=Dibothriocephalus latus TaxID=60516 RepID=A0A3P7LPS9_DIBLA|nr:unnamed protein product [Dibothriocephalus latus]